MCAIPRSREGVEARAHRAATAGASSPTSCRSASTPRMDSPPVTVSPSSSSTTSAPMRPRRSRRRSPAWVVQRGQPGTVTRPRLVMRQHQERRRVGQVRLDRDVGALDARGRNRPACRPPRRPRRRARAGRPPSSRCGGARARVVPRGARPRPSSYDAPASSSAETNWLEAEASIVTAPPRRRPRPATVKGSVPRPPSSTETPSSRRASSSPAIGRVRACVIAVEVHLPLRKSGHRRHEPHHRPRQAAVDGPAAQRAGERPASRNPR